MVFTIPELIRKKRNGFELAEEEVEFFVNAVVTKNIDGSQIGAMLMAMFLNKQTLRETIQLTRAMIRTGEVLEFEGHDRSVLVDKHSTGGVGDKVSIILAPALAACGLKVPMVSGRSLGYTGGTLDKLESIPDFQTRLDKRQMSECLAKSGCFICGATNSVAPADDILYKFRDITATVEDPNLIAASILSKKASEGIGMLVMDIKFGRGAMFRSESEAEKMAELLRDVAKELGLDMRVVISEMEAPLGRYVGNALEVVESVMCLRNESRNSVRELVTLLGGVILESKGMAKTVEEGKEMIAGILESSKALKCFFEMLVSQGVAEERASALCSGRYWEVLPMARHVTRIGSGKEGAVVGIDALGIAKACWHLGAGRVKAESLIDHSVGVVLLKEIGDDVGRDECWIEVHHSSEKLEPEVETLIRESLTVEERKGSHLRQSGKVLKEAAGGNVPKVGKELTTALTNAPALAVVLAREHRPNRRRRKKENCRWG